MAATVNPVLPVSHQFANLPAAFRARFHTVEFRSATEVAGWAADALVHTGLSLTDPAFPERVDFAALGAAPVRRFSFDVGPCFEQVEIVDNRYVGVGRKLSPAEALDRAEASLAAARERFPTGCELAVENLNFYPTGAYDGVCDAAFYNEACRRLGVGLVLDVAHARITAANRGTPFAAWLDDLDLGLVREVHLSRPGVDERTGQAIDRHDRPQAEEFAILAGLLARLAGRVDVVIEYYREADGIVAAYDDLARL